MDWWCLIDELWWWWKWCIMIESLCDGWQIEDYYVYIFNIFYPCLMIHRVSPTSWFWLRPIVSLFLLPKVQFVVVVVFGWLVVLPVCLPCHFSLAFLLSTYWISSLAYVIMFSPVLLFWFLSYALTMDSFNWSYY